MCINEDVMASARRADGRVDGDKVNEGCLEFNGTPFPCKYNRDANLEKTVAAFKEAKVWDIEDAVDMASVRFTLSHTSAEFFSI
jgi:hypothetical protein